MDLSDEEKQLILERRSSRLPKWEPKSKESYSSEEKIAFFDKSYDDALRILRAHENGERLDMEDEKQWMFESAMGLLGPDVWNRYNAVAR